MDIRAHISPLEGGAATEWNIEIGETVPGPWEPLLMDYGKCRSGDLVATWHSLQEQTAQPGNVLGPKGCVGPRNSQSVSLSCIPKTAWICWTRPQFERRDELLRSFSMNVELI